MNEAKIRMGVGQSAFYTALKELSRAEQVHACPFGKAKHLFIHSPGIEDWCPQVAALSDPDLKNLYHAVDELGLPTTQELQEHVEERFSWEVVKTKWMLQQLRQAGLVEACHSAGEPNMMRHRPFPLFPEAMRVLHSKLEGGGEDGE